MFETFGKVNISNCSSDGVMSVGGLLAFLGDCEQCQIDSETYLKEYLREHNMGMYLTSRYLEILDMPKYGDDIKAVTSIYELKGIFGCRNTFVYDASGNVLIKSYAMGAFIDLATAKLARVPQELLDKYALEPKLDMNYPPRNIITKGTEMLCDERDVYPYMIDIYQHVNNTHYITMASDYIKNHNAIKSIRVEYKIPTLLGDVLEIIKQVDEDKVYIKFFKGGMTCAVVEFGV